MNLDELLKRSASSVPDEGFTDAVMRKIAAEPTAHALTTAPRTRGFASIFEWPAFDFAVVAVAIAIATGPLARATETVLRSVRAFAGQGPDGAPVALVGFGLFALGLFALVGAEEVLD